jgi:enoyl-CoA hydratase/carnithine racemase
MDYETITVQDEGGVLFAELLAPPMNLLGPELVRDLVSLIQRAEADKAAQVLVFKSGDPDYFTRMWTSPRSSSTGRRRQS